MVVFGLGTIYSFFYIFIFYNKNKSLKIIFKMHISIFLIKNMSLAGKNRALDNLLNLGGKSTGYKNPTCKPTKMSEII